jgi:hypothetical protein
VEVIVLGEAHNAREVARYPLRGTPLPYVNPFPCIPGEQVFKELDELLR